MGIILVVVHCVVNIAALVVEQLSEGYHCRIFEILTEASSYKVNMYPSDVVLRQ
jgi:hypothetical protein